MFTSEERPAQPSKEPSSSDPTEMPASIASRSAKRRNGFRRDQKIYRTRIADDLVENPCHSDLALQAKATHRPPQHFNGALSQRPETFAHAPRRLQRLHVQGETIFAL